MNSKTVHYLWVGPPTKSNLSLLSGHDVVAPIEFSHKLKEQKLNRQFVIKFWCLSKYKKYYVKLFKKHNADIKVCSIEDYINSLNDKENQNNLKNQMHLRDAEQVNDRVMFKDIFSLILLAYEAGYVFDTNVFPILEGTINLGNYQEVRTAISQNDGHDFYAMYSPSPQHPNVLRCIENWFNKPSIWNLKAFADLPKHFLDLESSGVYKRSYKSYIASPILLKGLFIHLDSSTPKELLEALPYDALNHPVSSPDFILLLEKFTMHHTQCLSLDANNLLEMPFKTDIAYVIQRGTFAFNMGLGCFSNVEQIRIFYVKKSTSETALIYSGKQAVNLYELGCSNDIKNVIEFEKNEMYCNSSRLRNLFNILPQDKVIFSPRHLRNIDGYTLLHHAIFLHSDSSDGRIEHIKALLENKADVKAVATFKIHPTGEILRFTPIEFATYLRLTDVVEVLQEYQSKHVALTSDDLSGSSGLKSLDKSDSGVKTPQWKWPSIFSIFNASEVTPSPSTTDFNRRFRSIKA